MRPFLTIAWGVALTCAVFAAEPEWIVANTWTIGGEGGWDYLTLDAPAHRLYVPRTTHTMVVDTESGRVVGDIPGQKNAHGVAIAPRVGRGFISDGGGEGAVVVFDLKSNAILGSLAALPDADGIIFDPSSGYVLVASGRGKALMTFRPDIDVTKGKIDPAIPLRGEPEFLAADAHGKVYINLMDTHEVAVADLKTRQVVANWPVAPGGLLVGMALDRGKERVFIGCRGPQKLIVMSTRDGKVLSDASIGESVDAVKLDGGQAFASTAGAQLFVAGEKSPGKYSIVQTVKTGEGARTMAMDTTGHKIYLPAAEFETATDGRRVAKPGTFRIVVVSMRPAR